MRRSVCFGRDRHKPVGSATGGRRRRERRAVCRSARAFADFARLAALPSTRFPDSSRISLGRTPARRFIRGSARKRLARFAAQALYLRHKFERARRSGKAYAKVKESLTPADFESCPGIRAERGLTGFCITSKTTSVTFTSRPMKRFHLHLRVYDLEANIRFYSALFGSLPAAHHDDCAYWLIENPKLALTVSRGGPGPGLELVGLDVDTDAELEEVRRQFAKTDIASPETEVSAAGESAPDKHQLIDPQGILWEARKAPHKALLGFGGDAAASCM